MERFWNKVDHTEECWIWRGNSTPGKPDTKNYGLFKVGRQNVRAHRFSYEQQYGEIPKDREIHHTCGTTLCVRPDHLVAVTRQEHRSIEQSNRSECKHGHPRTPENTRVRKRGTWTEIVCKKCDVARHRRRALAP